MDPVDHSSHRNHNSSSDPMALPSTAEMVASQVEMVTEDSPVLAEMEMANRDTVQVVLATSALKTHTLPRTNVRSNLTTTSSSALDHHRDSDLLREIIIANVEDSNSQEDKDHLRTRMDHLMDMDRVRDQRDTGVNLRISTMLPTRILLLLHPTMAHLDKILTLLHHPHLMDHRDRQEVLHQQETTMLLPPEMATLLVKDLILELHPHLMGHRGRQEVLHHQEATVHLPTETPPDKDRMLLLHPHHTVHQDRQEMLLQQETIMVLQPETHPVKDRMLLLHHHHMVPQDRQEVLLQLETTTLLLREMATLLAKDLMLVLLPHLTGHLARVVVPPIKDQIITSPRTIMEMMYSLLNRLRPVMEYRTRIVSMAQIVSRMAANSLPRHLITEPPMKVNSHLPHLITEHLMKVSKINLD